MRIRVHVIVLAQENKNQRFKCDRFSIRASASRSLPTVRGAATAFRLSKRKWSLRPCRSVTGVRKNDTSISAVRGNPCLDWAACHRPRPWSRSHFLPGCGGQRSSRGRLCDHSRELSVQIQYGSERDQNLFQLVGYRPRGSSRLSRGLHQERHDPNHLVVPQQQVFLRWKSVAACRKARGESLFLQPASLAAIGRGWALRFACRSQRGKRRLLQAGGSMKSQDSRNPEKLS